MRRRKFAPRADVYRTITDRVVAALAEGTVPWRRPWLSQRPASVASGHAYRGINWLVLSMVADDRGYGSTTWGTYRAWQERGAQVRGGETGSPIVVWSPWTPKPTQDDPEPASRLYRKGYSVFNAAQVDGWVEPEAVEAEVIESAEAVAERYLASGVSLAEGGDRAYYAPRLDAIQMPPRAAFPATSWYPTLYHEMAHSTGHSSRLDRGLDGDQAHGREDYAREELIAEIASAMLCATTGVEPEIEQSAAYIKGWMRALADDASLLPSAAQAAQKAADWVIDPPTEKGE